MNVKPLASLVTAICVLKKLPYGRETVGKREYGVTVGGGKGGERFEAYS